MKIYLLNLTFLITVLNTVADKTKGIGILGVKQLGEMCTSGADCAIGSCVPDDCNVNLCRIIITNEEDCDGKLHICPNNGICVISDCGNKCVPNTPPGCGGICTGSHECTGNTDCSVCKNNKCSKPDCGDYCQSDGNCKFSDCKSCKENKCKISECGGSCAIHSHCSGVCNYCDEDKKKCVQLFPCGENCKATEHQEFVKCDNFNGAKCHCHNSKPGIEAPLFRCEMNCNDKGCEPNTDPSIDVCDKKCPCKKVNDINVCTHK